jgi:hypothetical protein
VRRPRSTRATRPALAVRVSRARGGHTRGQGHIDAALDAGYQALSLAPGNVDLHLELIGLYLDRGWRAPAVEKLRLLHRLVDLGDEASARERLLGGASTGDYAELAAEAGVATVAT